MIFYAVVKHINRIRIRKCLERCWLFLHDDHKSVHYSNINIFCPPNIITHAWSLMFLHVPWDVLGSFVGILRKALRNTARNKHDVIPSRQTKPNSFVCSYKNRNELSRSFLLLVSTFWVLVYHNWNTVGTPFPGNFIPRFDIAYATFVVSCAKLTTS